MATVAVSGRLTLGSLHHEHGGGAGGTGLMAIGTLSSGGLPIRGTVGQRGQGQVVPTPPRRLSARYGRLVGPGCCLPARPLTRAWLCSGLSGFDSLPLPR